MKASFFTPQKKKIFRSLHYSPAIPNSTERTQHLKVRNQKSYKPNFLYFTQRERQAINFFETTQPLIKTKYKSLQKEIDFKISGSFHKKFKLNSKHFDIKKQSPLKNISFQQTKQHDFVVFGKTKQSLKKKACFYKNQEPCVGSYNVKPESFMKRISKNQLFRKGKSCHTLSLNKQNHQCFVIKNTSIHQKNKSSTQVDKGSPKQRTKKKGTLNPLIIRCIQEDSNIKPCNVSSQKTKIRIKCFDMGKQTARLPLKKIANKIEQGECDNDYIQKNYRRGVLIPSVMNEHQLKGIYENHKKKYKIESSCGILKYIKLEDFIKIHRNESVIDEQNFE